MSPVGAERVVVYPSGRQYGHLGIELAMGLAEARARRGALWVLAPAAPVGEALLALESDEVRVAHARGPWRAGLSLVRVAATTRRDLRRWRRQAAESVLEGAIARITVHVKGRTLPEAVRDWLRGRRTWLAARLRHVQRPPGETPYLRRRLLRAPVSTRLPEALVARARDEARAAGIDDDAPVICVHAREVGFKRGGLEVHEKQRAQGKRRVRDDAARNASIRGLLPVMAWLVARGFTVVRIGDPTMEPIAMPGVVDLATAPARSSLLEVHCLLRARFLIAGESGPAGVSYLTNTPLLQVNATDPIGSYPIRATGLLLPKAVRDRASGRRLSVEELLSEAYLARLRDTAVFAYEDNTPEEVQAAAEEMLALLEGDPEDARQAAFRSEATRVASTLVPSLRYLRKWRADDGFLGDGRLARVAWEAA
jgi:putative glycosyltransferase (TIGR04372 family)